MPCRLRRREGLRNAVAHVLENAAKYSDDVIDVDRTRPTRVPPVRVHDRGRGIRADDLVAIMQDGNRGRTAMRKTVPTKVGLTKARRIAGEHGGMLRITSVPGEGTTVTITLPRFRRLAVVLTPVSVLGDGQFRSCRGDLGQCGVARDGMHARDESVSTRTRRPAARRRERTHRTQ